MVTAYISRYEIEIDYVSIYCIACWLEKLASVVNISAAYKPLLFNQSYLRHMPLKNQAFNLWKKKWLQYES